MIELAERGAVIAAMTLWIGLDLNSRTGTADPLHFAAALGISIVVMLFAWVVRCIRDHNRFQRITGRSLVWFRAEDDEKRMMIKALLEKVRELEIKRNRWELRYRSTNVEADALTEIECRKTIKWLLRIGELYRILDHDEIRRHMPRKAPAAVDRGQPITGRGTV